MEFEDRAESHEIQHPEVDDMQMLMDQTTSRLHYSDYVPGITIKVDYEKATKVVEDSECLVIEEAAVYEVTPACKSAREKYRQYGYTDLGRLTDEYLALRSRLATARRIASAAKLEYLRMSMAEWTFLQEDQSYNVGSQPTADVVHKACSGILADRQSFRKAERVSELQQQCCSCLSNRSEKARLEVTELAVACGAEERHGVNVCNHSTNSAEIPCAVRAFFETTRDAFIDRERLSKLEEGAEFLEAKNFVDNCLVYSIGPGDGNIHSSWLARLLNRLLRYVSQREILSKIPYLFIARMTPTTIAAPLSAASTHPPEPTLQSLVDTLLSLAPVAVLACGIGCAYRTLKSSRQSMKEPVLLSVQAIVAALVWWAIKITVEGSDPGKNIAISTWAALLTNKMAQDYRILKHKNQFLVASTLGGVFSTVLLAALGSINPNVASSMQRVVEQAIECGPCCLSIWASFVFWLLLHVEQNEQQHEADRQPHLHPELPTYPTYDDTVARPGLYQAYHRGTPSMFELLDTENVNNPLNNPW